MITLGECVESSYKCKGVAYGVIHKLTEQDHINIWNAVKNYLKSKELNEKS